MMVEGTVAEEGAPMGIGIGSVWSREGVAALASERVRVEVVDGKLRAVVRLDVPADFMHMLRRFSIGARHA